MAQTPVQEEYPLVWVKPHPSQGNRTALWDRGPAYPGGEVYLSGQAGPPVQVPATPAVQAALLPQSGQPPRLVQLEGRQLEQARQQADEALEAREQRRQQALGAKAQRLRAQLAGLEALQGATAAQADAGAPKGAGAEATPQGAQGEPQGAKPADAAARRR